MPAEMQKVCPTKSETETSLYVFSESSNPWSLKTYTNGRCPILGAAGIRCNSEHAFERCDRVAVNHLASANRGTDGSIGIA